MLWLSLAHTLTSITLPVLSNKSTKNFYIILTSLVTISCLEKLIALRMSPLIKWKILGHSLRVLVTINTFFQLLAF